MRRKALKETTVSAELKEGSFLGKSFGTTLLVLFSFLITIIETVYYFSFRSNHATQKEWKTNVFQMFEITKFRQA
jgi:hypothetical protein